MISALKHFTVLWYGIAVASFHGLSLFILNIAMSGCTLRFSRNSPLRTILVDEATGWAKYQIDTPRWHTRSVTRIRKLDSAVQPPSDWNHPDLDPDDDIADKGKPKREENDAEEDEPDTGTELAETSDEIARIY